MGACFSSYLMDYKDRIDPNLKRGVEGVLVISNHSRRYLRRKVRYRNTGMRGGKDLIIGKCHRGKTLLCRG